MRRRSRLARLAAALSVAAMLALGLLACGGDGGATTGSAGNPEPFTLDLDELKAMPALAECRLLARGNRLSVFPITDDEFDAIVRQGSRRR